MLLAPILVDEVLEDVCSWLHCGFLQAVSELVHGVVPFFWSVNMILDAAYNVFLNLFCRSHPVGSLSGRGLVGIPCLVSNLLSVLVAFPYFW